jgi:hypothetical protein
MGSSLPLSLSRLENTMAMTLSRTPAILSNRLSLQYIEIEVRGG